MLSVYLERAAGPLAEMQVGGVASLDDLRSPVTLPPRDLDRDGLLLCLEETLPEEPWENIKNPAHMHACGRKNGELVSTQPCDQRNQSLRTSRVCV